MSSGSGVMYCFSGWSHVIRGASVLLEELSTPARIILQSGTIDSGISGLVLGIDKEPTSTSEVSVVVVVPAQLASPGGRHFSSSELNS